MDDSKIGPLTFSGFFFLFDHIAVILILILNELAKNEVNLANNLNITFLL